MKYLVTVFVWCITLFAPCITQGMQNCYNLTIFETNETIQFGEAETDAQSKTVALQGFPVSKQEKMSYDDFKKRYGIIEGANISQDTAYKVFVELRPCMVQKTKNNNWIQWLFYPEKREKRNTFLEGSSEELDEITYRLSSEDAATQFSGSIKTAIKTTRTISPFAISLALVGAIGLGYGIYNKWFR